MALFEIFGVEEGFFWGNVGYISVYIMLGLCIYFGIKFIHDSRQFEKGSSQREYFIGLGLFIISIAIGEGTYLTDLYLRILTGGMNEGTRIFFTIEMWQELIGYNLESVIAYDYYVAITITLLLSLSFLMNPLEKFMLRREKRILTHLTRILTPFPFIIRVFEVNLASWFGPNFQVVDGSVPFYVFMALWFVIIGIIAISISFFIYLYLKMGIKAPTGSSLKKKSILIILGFFLWIIAVLLTSSIFREVEDGSWYLFPIVPVLLVLALSCMVSGFKREI